MRMKSIRKFVSERRNPLIVGLIVLFAGILYMRGALTRGKDVYVLRKDTPAPDSLAAALPKDTAAAPESTESRKIVVYVTGEVTNPGVYELDKDSRVNDALILAGGCTEEADMNRINLASPLSDGAQITVPKLGGADGGPEQEPIVTVQPVDETSANGLVNINTASEAQLETLPGVGPATAKAIVEYRDKHGDFKKISDIKKVSGIGDAKFERIRDLITV